MNWLIYYSLSIALTLISTYIFKPFVNISLFSFLPICYILCHVYYIVVQFVFSRTSPLNRLMYRKNKANNNFVLQPKITDIGSNFTQVPGYNYDVDGKLIFKSVKYTYEYDRKSSTIYYKRDYDHHGNIISERNLSLEIYLYSLVSYIPFIFFFSDKTKAMSIFLFFIPVMIEIVMSIPISIELKKYEKARRDFIKKELEEQKRKEELGRYR